MIGLGVLNLLQRPSPPTLVVVGAFVLLIVLRPILFRSMMGKPMRWPGPKSGKRRRRDPSDGP
jgi:hypothetical protein